MVSAPIPRRPIVAVVLTIAVLLGGVAGGYTAYTVQRSQAPSAGSSPSAEPSNDGTESAEPDTDDGLFYFADGTIHDGNREVPALLSRDVPVSTVQRVGDGWLVVQLLTEGGEQEEYFGTYVYADGSTWELGGLGQTWDVDPRGRVLFSPELWRWYAADPATHKLNQLKVMDGTGSEPEFVHETGPVLQLQWGGSGVVTGWANSQGYGQMVLTDVPRSEHTVVGPSGAERPNTSPDGRLAVGSVLGSQPDSAACLSGGELTSDRWWQRCDYLRLSYSSPYSPDGRSLLVIGKEQPRTGIGSVVILDSRTGEVQARLKTPATTLDVAWADNESLSLLTGSAEARDKVLGSNRAQDKALHRLSLDGSRQRIGPLPDDGALGEA